MRHGNSSGIRGKGTSAVWKPLLSNGSEDVAVDMRGERERALILFLGYLTP
jgi:hypothetical protein